MKTTLIDELIIDLGVRMYLGVRHDLGVRMDHVVMMELGVINILYMDVASIDLN